MTTPARQPRQAAQSIVVLGARIVLDGPSETAHGHAADWFAAILAEAAEAVGGKVTEARCRIYAHELRHYEPVAVVEAVRACWRTSTKFFPALPEILQQFGPSPDDAGLLAWRGLFDAAARVGAYESIEIEDAAVARAMLRVFGSWSALCASEAGPELHTRRQEFLAALRDERRQLGASTAPVKLAGLLEAGKLGAGEYVPRWRGRLTAAGAVVVEREPPTLPAAPDQRQLPAGSKE